MAVKVAATIEPMAAGEFPVVSATNVSGLSNVATSGSYSDLSNKPNGGTSSVPIYMNKGVATPLTNLRFNIPETSITLHESDFELTEEPNVYKYEIRLDYLTQMLISGSNIDISFVSAPWIWYTYFEDEGVTNWGFVGQQTVGGATQNLDCWYVYPYLYTYKESWPQNWYLSISYVTIPDVFAKKLRVYRESCTTEINPDSICISEYGTDLMTETHITYEQVKTSRLTLGETVLDEEKLKKLLALAENTNNIYMPVLGLVE